MTSTQYHSSRLFIALITVALLLAACGGAGSQGPGASPAVETAEPQPPTSGPATAEPAGEDPLPEDTPAEETAEPTEASEPAGDGQEVIVYAAASLTDVFDALAAEFEAQNPGVRVVRNYGSSLQLATQIIEGAPAAMFASADEQQMATVVESGRITGPTVTFALNRLALVVPAGNPGQVTSVAALAQEGVTFVTAMPGVPIREYTNVMLEQMASDPTFGRGFVEAVNANLVSEEDSVRKIVAKIALGEADVGVVYRTDVTADVAGDVELVEIPEEYNVIAAYPVGVIADAPHPDLAEAFTNFILSDTGQAILADAGFEPAAGG